MRSCGGPIMEGRAIQVSCRVSPPCPTVQEGSEEGSEEGGGGQSIADHNLGGKGGEQ